MDDVAVSVDAAHHYLAVIVGERFRFHETFAAALGRFVPGRGRIFYFQRDCLHTVAMFVNVVRDRIIRMHRRSQNKRQLALSNRITRAIPYSSFRPGLRETLKTNHRLVKMCRLFGVTDVEFDVVSTLKWEKILFGRRDGFRFWSSNCRWHNDLLTLSRRARRPNIRSTTARRKGSARVSRAGLGVAPKQSFL